MPRRIAQIVSFDLPEGATREEAIAYIEDAIHSFAGSYRPPGAYDLNDPGDPMFSLDRSSIRVRNI